ncbi:MAG: hypothetical protein JNJ55_01450, partial [Betaproteobacteria bacterium]|nr:hypothetical protein [Betaproteobacteria bacterium]
MTHLSGQFRRTHNNRGKIMQVNNTQRWLACALFLTAPAAMAALPTSATLVSMQNGDTGCYLMLKDDQGKTHSQLGDFDLCETGKA